MKEKIIIASITILLSAMILIPKDASAASRESFAYIGWSFGIGIGTGQDANSDTEEGGSLYGPNGKIVWGITAPIAGIGYSSFSTQFADNAFIGGESKYSAKGYVGELIIPFENRSESAFTYLLLSGGRMYEYLEKKEYTPVFVDYSYTGTKYAYSRQEQHCSILGAGLGYMTIPDTQSSMSFGFEVRYLEKLDNKISESPGGLFSLIFMAGLVF